MKYVIRTESTLTGVTAEEIFAVWSDVANTPAWDPREDLNELDGPFMAGTTGRFRQGKRSGEFTILEVGPGLTWRTSNPLPGGALVVDHAVSGVDGGVHVVKTYTVSGPLVPLFRVYYGRQICREMPGTFAALEVESRRRVAAAGRRT